jgi:peptidoglycan hydrolase CwlO-like protein
MEMTTHANGQGNGKKLTLHDLQKHLIGVIVGSVFSTIVTGIFFYFNTNHTLDNHTSTLTNHGTEITNVKKDIGEIKTDVAILKSDVNYVKNDLVEIKDSQKQMQEDMKDIYKIVLTLKDK